jgi:hypothetical protein
VRSTKRTREPGETRSLEEFIAQEDPHAREKWAMSELPNLIDHQGLGQLLNNMHWFVITTDADAPRLLTSDRPLFISGKLGAPDCHLTLPIAPDRLFVAVNSKDSETTFRARPHPDLIEETNVRTVQRATKYAYSNDNARREFVDRHLSTARQPSHFESLLTKKRASREVDAG